MRISVIKLSGSKGQRRLLEEGGYEDVRGARDLQVRAIVYNFAWSQVFQPPRAAILNFLSKYFEKSRVPGHTLPYPAANR